MFMIPTADDLVTYIKGFTGSSNDDEIKQCIFQAELAMRNIELPSLRNDPWTEGVVYAGANSDVPIPADMNKPILFFSINSTPGNPTSALQSGGTGPWLVYDRIGDRDIITQSLIAQLYLAPFNVPAVIRGKFSEVGGNYKFLPWISEGAQIHLYYYKAWDLLFTPVYDGPTQVGTVQTNPVLQSWPEGYVYGTLHEYYVKRHNSEDAAIYKAKFDDAWKTVENQNNLGKWSGGHTRLTSIFQPRRERNYAIK